jgi:hypothetical protein
MSKTRLSRDWSRLGPALAASAFAIAAVGCHGSGKSSNDATPVVVTIGQCPAERESAASKIYGEANLPTQPTAPLTATIVLRPLSQTVVTCPGDTSSDARCAARDDSLTERSALNSQEWACIGRDIAGTGLLPPTTAVWYEVPYHLTAGRPVPVGTMVQLLMTLEQIERVAQHPFVERIEPPVGKAWAWGAGAPLPPDDCPKATDAPLAKLARLTSIQGLGLQPVVIELKDGGVLHPEVPCTSGTACPQSVDALWDRTIMNTRELTCVRRWIDAQVKEVPPTVAYAVATGSIGGAVLPPFEQPTATVKAFGLGLTWDEAVGIAKHPFVESIWTTPGLAIDSAASGCPPDFNSPVAPVACPSDRESFDGKISAAARSALEGSSGPQQVIVRVRGGATICALPQCPGQGQPCPERDMYTALWTAENAESQHCVRDLITQIGGTSDPAVYWIANFFNATLTWAQIQLVAAHPHVSGIELAVGGGTTAF